MVASALRLAGEPQGTLLIVQVWEDGESECRAVTVRIGVETLPHAISGQTSVWSTVARRLTTLCNLVRCGRARPY
jgi:hypothetical protein